jgi:hypothetical protein
LQLHVETRLWIDGAELRIGHKIPTAIDSYEAVAAPIAEEVTAGDGNWLGVEWAPIVPGKNTCGNRSAG